MFSYFHLKSISNNGLPSNNVIYSMVTMIYSITLIHFPGAISSIAHHPLQYVISEEPHRSLVNSIGLGLVGVITRPLSGVAELVALTGEGLLSGVGWTNTPTVHA